ncbi:MAG TPA: S8 family peptidase, partial [Gemmatales bacterium]|nr:S8 family peptidase [Gemmatales bacterium]
MALPRPASALRTLRLICEVLEDRLQPDASLIANLAAGNYVPDHILVQFKPDVTPKPILGTTITSSLSLIPGLFDIQLPQGLSVAQALDAYNADLQVVSSQPDYLIQADAVPNDPSFSQQWALNGNNPTASISAPTAWNTTTGSGNTIVATIDSGIDTSHPDLAANLWTNAGEIPGNGIDDDHNGFVDDVHGYNFINSTGNNNDDYGHGTHVAGIIGAVGNNGLGVTGVNWNVKIMALKFLNYNGSGSTSNALRALNYAVQMGATISNNSWTSPAYDTALETGIRNAGLAGHIYVAAAGNLAQNLDTNKLYPASFALDNVVTVAALDSNNNLAGWSNYGQTVDIAAPGVDIYSTLPGGNYGYMSGTSMATPFVTGAIALVRDAHPTWTAQQVIRQVLSTADTLPSLTGKINGGRLDVGAAIGIPVLPPP